MGGDADNQFKVRAAEAAKRIDHAREAGQQLSFLPDPDGQGGQLVEEKPRGPGRPKGSKNKIDSQLREMFAARGFRMPEDVAAEIAGLSSREDVFLVAMQRTEQLLAWAGDGHPEKVLVEGVVHERDWKPAPAQRLATFIDVYKSMVKMVESLLPYGLPKVTPDQHTHVQAVQVVLPGRAPGADPRVIEGRAATDFAPPPMPQEIERNQQVRKPENRQSDGGSRTE